MKPYNIIVIDPPWLVNKLVHKSRPNQKEMDYKRMTDEQIANMNIPLLADKECWLFLWTTQKFLFKAKNILDGWGFRYMLTMVWEKTYGRSSGMPLKGFRWNCEFILVGTNFNPTLWPKRPLIPCCFQAENIRHSQKPDKFYELIKDLGEKRVDIFARQRRDGWDAWGDEVVSDPIFGGDNANNN